MRINPLYDSQCRGPLLEGAASGSASDRWKHLKGNQ